MQISSRISLLIISDPTAKEAIITLKGTTVKYVGKINDENVERLLELAKEKTVTELIISSGGGEIGAGMRMGEWVMTTELMWRLKACVCRGLIVWAL